MDTTPELGDVFLKSSEFGGQSQLFIDEAKKEVALGIMFHFNVTDKLRQGMAERGVTIPEDVKQIDVLSVAPDESFEPRSRINEDPKPTKKNLSGKRWTWKSESPPSTYYAVINKLFGENKDGSPNIDRLAGTLASLIIEVCDPFNSKFGRPDEAKKEGDKILIIQGHGGGNPHMLGERTDIGIDKAYKTHEAGKLSQKPGNRIITDELIIRYDKPNTYCDIFVNACNINEVNLSPTRVPVHYVLGYTTSYLPAGRALTTKALTL